MKPVIGCAFLGLALTLGCSFEKDDRIQGCVVVDDLGPESEFAYVANADEGTITVVEPRSCTIVTTIDVGGRPVSLNASASGSFVYVANQTRNVVSIIDTVEQEVIKEIPVVDSPTELRASHDHRVIWVLGKEGGYSQIDIKTSSHLGDYESELGVQYMGMNERAPYTAFLSNSDAGTITMVDAASNSVVETIELETTPRDLDFSAVSEKMYVCSDEGLFVVETNGALANTITQHLEIGACQEIRFDEEHGRYGWVALRDSNEVAIIDTTDDTIAAMLPQEGLPSRARFMPDFGLVAFTHSATSMSLISTTDLAIVGEVEVGEGTTINRASIESLDRRHIYIVNPDDSTISIINVETQEVRGVVSVGEGASSIVLAGPNGGTCC